jgi:hypothetical protein
LKPFHLLKALITARKPFTVRIEERKSAKSKVVV